MWMDVKSKQSRNDLVDDFRARRKGDWRRLWLPDVFMRCY